MVERSALADGTVRVVTEQDGEDDDRATTTLPSAIEPVTFPDCSEGDVAERLNAAVC